MKTEPKLKINVRRAQKRGKSRANGLQRRHTFSFGDYLEPEQVGFRSLRVINEDLVDPETSLNSQLHHSIEIFSYVVSGEMEYHDDQGNAHVLKAGAFQHISAGTGIEHEESNPSDQNAAHLLHIWIQQKGHGGVPHYIFFDTKSRKSLNGLKLLASPQGEKHSAPIRQEAQIYLANIKQGKELSIPELTHYPYSWIQIVDGELNLANKTLKAGDGAAVEASQFDVHALQDTEFFLFRLT